MVRARRGGRARRGDPAPLALDEIEAPQIVQAPELALPAEHVQRVVHDHGAVAVPAGRRADSRVRGARRHLRVGASAGPTLERGEELALGGESAVGVQLALPHHGRGADEVRLGRRLLRRVVLLVRNVEVFVRLRDVRQRGGRGVRRRGGGTLAPVARLEMRFLILFARRELVPRDDGDELAARVAQRQATRRRELGELRRGHALEGDAVDLHVVRL